MLKLFGAVLIISGTTAWGASSVLQMRKRVRALNSLVHSMDLMSDEICTNITPMPDLLLLMSKSAPRPARDLYARAGEKISRLGEKSFRELWQISVDETPSLLLERDEREILFELGAGLGKYDFETQGRLIQSAKKRLEARAEQAEQERLENSKLHAFLGVAAGMFAVVVLI